MSIDCRAALRRLRKGRALQKIAARRAEDPRTATWGRLLTEAYCVAKSGWRWDGDGEPYIVARRLRVLSRDERDARRERKDDSMKVIFLDIDGVLNYGLGELVPDLVNRLNRIVRETGAEIVVHSWRRYCLPPGRIVDELVRSGVVAKFAGVCDTVRPPEGHRGVCYPYGVAGERGIAIRRWLAARPGVDRFVIFDDSPDLGSFVGTSWLLPTQSHEGLTDAHVERAIAILNGPRYMDETSGGE